MRETIYGLFNGEGKKYGVSLIPNQKAIFKVQEVGLGLEAGGRGEGELGHVISHSNVIFF